MKCGPIMGLHNKKIFLVLTAFALFLFIKLISRSRQTRTNEAQYGGYKDCRKKTKVGFLKTHKCASSSLQNILMRFSLNNDLNIVLPSAGEASNINRKYKTRTSYYEALYKILGIILNLKPHARRRVSAIFICKSGNSFE